MYHFKRAENNQLEEKVAAIKGRQALEAIEKAGAGDFHWPD